MAIRDRLRRHRKRLLAVALLAAVAWCVSWIPQARFFWSYRVRAEPVLWLVPVEASLPKVEPARLFEVSEDGWTFSVPWSAPRSSERKAYLGRDDFVLRVIEFAEGRRVKLNPAEPDEVPLSFWREAMKQDPSGALARRLYGEAGREDTWRALDVVLRTTPAELRLWMPWQESFRVYLLLYQKQWVLSDGLESFSMLQTAHAHIIVHRLKGSKGPGWAKVYADDGHCTSVFIHALEGAPPVTTDELGTIVATIRHSETPAAPAD